MIYINKGINLQEITLNDHIKLYHLMCEIYPREYNHFWLDDSSWYINSQFSKENLKKELAEEKQYYYFVLYEEEVIGIVRLLFDKELEKYPAKKSVKLHRIYLHHKVQGKGIGKAVLQYIETFVKSENYDYLWLEAMEKKPLALKFYQNFGFKKADEYLYEFDLLKKEYQKMIAIYKEYEH